MGNFLSLAHLETVLQQHRPRNDLFLIHLHPDHKQMMPRDGANTKERGLVARKWGPCPARERKIRTDREAVLEEQFIGDSFWR